MKRLSILPMILCLVLTLGTSCRTIPETTKIDVVPYVVALPTAPDLVPIPTDTSGAVKALTLDLSRVDTYSQILEWYIQFQNAYYKTIIQIISK